MFCKNRRQIGPQVGNKNGGVHFNSFKSLIINDKIGLELKFRKSQCIIQILSRNPQGQTWNVKCNKAENEVFGKFCQIPLFARKANFLQLFL